MKRDHLRARRNECWNEKKMVHLNLCTFSAHFFLSHSERLCNWYRMIIAWLFFFFFFIAIKMNFYFHVWILLTSTMKRPAGSLSMAISKNTRGNPIFVVAKLRRHNWIKLDWLAKWFWFSVCRRPIERACRHSVPATREAIFFVIRTLRSCVRLCACGKCECIDAAQGIEWQLCVR